MQRTGIMGAMPEEIEGILDLISGKAEKRIGGRIYYSGYLNNIPVVVAFSRWGKVAAASTVSAMIYHFGISSLVFTGVAGAIHDKLRIGDIVIAERLVQHDMDARPLMPRLEIPLLSKTWFETDPGFSEKARMAVEHILDDLPEFDSHRPTLHMGKIASGDQFFSTAEQKHTLKQLLPDILCVEMEGAAVAQVCFENDIPFIVIRTISDIAGENSGIDFPLFIKTVASKYSVAILDRMFSLP